jgi:tetratricopeptide (TPR) repeat protein
VDGLSDQARRLIAAAMAQDAPPAGAEDESWGMVISRVDEGVDSHAPLDSDAPSQRTIVAPAEPAKAAHMPAPGERIGRFLVIDVLGQGAMGVVVRAFDPRLERTLAIKVVSPKRGGDKAERARARLVAEARALARISHPNVVAVYEVDVHDGLDYVAMELVDGIDLQRWLRLEPRGWREIVAAFAAAADGLHAVHLAGLVHRDVKPANILMGHDGRVRVGDFGIATRRTADAPTPTPSVHGDWADISQEGVDPDRRYGAERPPDITSLTEEGQVVGTPAYMAPEQHFGATLTPAADQYALCVSLYEALWRTRPFVVPLLQLAAAKRKPPRQMPPGHDVPRWLFRIVARGLAVDPKQRFASMGELATALRHDVGRRRRRLAFAATTIAGITAGALIATPAPPCAGAADKLAGIWDTETRAAVEQAFARSARPWAAASWAQVRTQLDAYATRWIAMHTDACEATRVRGEQSEALLDRRMVCLDVRRDALSAAVELLQTGDDDTVDAAFTMVGRLRSVAPCGDIEGVAAQVAPPDDPEVRAHVEQLRADVARARASYDAGRYDEALAVADATTETARSIGYEALIAEAEVIRGDILQTRHRHEESRAALQQAVWIAIGIGHDSVAVEGAESMVWLQSEYLRDFAGAAQWVEILRATLRRSGSPPSVAAHVGNVIGASLANVGRYDDALAEYEYAASLIVDDPAERFTLHSLRTNMGNVYMTRGEGARAREIYATELAAFETLLGMDHPRVNLLRRLLADALGEAGERDLAVEQLEAAAASIEKAFGVGSSELGNARVSLAIAYGRVGRQAEALALYERGRDDYIQAGDQAGLAIALGNIGGLEAKLRHFDAANAALDRALSIQREIYGGDHGDMVYPLVEKADIAITQRRFAEALALAIEAERIAAATLDPASHERIVAKQTRSNALSELGRYDEAIALARETLALALASEDLRAGTRAVARERLGSLLLRSGAPEEALPLLDASIADYRAIDDIPGALTVSLERVAALTALGQPDAARTAAAAVVDEAERGGWTELAKAGRALAGTR